jgi:hypothetical protein
MITFALVLAGSVLAAAPCESLKALTLMIDPTVGSSCC